jgi:hypothetical protein
MPESLLFAPMAGLAGKWLLGENDPGAANGVTGPPHLLTGGFHRSRRPLRLPLEDTIGIAPSKTGLTPARRPRQGTSFDTARKACLVAHYNSNQCGTLTNVSPCLKGSQSRDCGGMCKWSGRHSRKQTVPLRRSEREIRWMADGA